MVPPKKRWNFPTKPWFRLGGVEYEGGRDYSFSLRNPNMNVVMIPFPDLLTGDIHMAPQKICLEEAPHKTLQWSMWVLITSNPRWHIMPCVRTMFWVPLGLGRVRLEDPPTSH